MSSFFLKGKPKINNKRKFVGNKKEKKVKKSKSEPIQNGKNDEIDSDLEVDGDNRNYASESESDHETPQDKRLRLAKKYLEEIELEEKARAADNQVDENISQRLNEDYLDSIGKLRRHVADNYTGYNATDIRVIKHKLQKLPMTCVCLSQDDKFLFTGTKNSIIVKWDLKETKSAGHFDCTKTRASNALGKPQLMSLALSSDFKFLALADHSNDIQIWCPTQLKHLHSFRGHRDIVTGLIFRKDTHTLYSVSKDRAVKVWSLDEMAYVESMFGHQAAITDIDALYRERAITCGGSDCSIRVWKIAEESQLVYNGHKGCIESVKLINDENFLSAGNDGALSVWSTLKKKPLYTVSLAHGEASSEANWISSIATYLNTDLVASGSCDGFIRIWKVGLNFRNLSQIMEIPIKGFINSLQFSNDGTKLIAAVGQEHRLGRWWSLKDAKNSIVIIPFLIK